MGFFDKKFPVTVEISAKNEEQAKKIEAGIRALVKHDDADELEVLANAIATKPGVIKKAVSAIKMRLI